MCIGVLLRRCGAAEDSIILYRCVRDAPLYTCGESAGPTLCNMYGDRRRMGLISERRARRDAASDGENKKNFGAG